MGILEKIWVPKTAKPKYVCKLCPDGIFYDGEERAWQAHVARCAAEHHDEIVAVVEKRRPPGFFKPFDPEYAEYVRRGGKPG